MTTPEPAEKIAERVLRLSKLLSAALRIPVSDLSQLHDELWALTNNAPALARAYLEASKRIAECQKDLTAAGITIAAANERIAELERQLAGAKETVWMLVEQQGGRAKISSHTIISFNPADAELETWNEIDGSIIIAARSRESAREGGGTP